MQANMRRFLTLLLVGSLALLTHALQKSVEDDRLVVTWGEEGPGARPALSARRARTVALGQHTTLADVQWLRLIQYLGTESVVVAGAPQLLAAADLITDLDPEFGYVYEVAGIALSTHDRLDESDVILEKGMRNVPHRWRLPFYSSFNHWYGRSDYATGARLLLQAARIPESPGYLGQLAAQLFSSADALAPGISLIDAMLREQLPDAVAHDLALRKRDLLVERHLRALEEAIESFEKRHGERPASLSVLLGGKPPRAPDGSLYEYDPATGRVSSPLLPERLQYYRADDVPLPTAIPR